MRKLAIALVGGSLLVTAVAAFANDDRPPTSLVDQRQPTRAEELAAKNPGPKRGPITPPPRPIDIKPIDRMDPMSAAPGAGASIGALVPVTSGASAVAEKNGLERELRRLATRLK